MLYCLLTVSHTPPAENEKLLQEGDQGLAAITPQPNPPPLPLADCLRFPPLQHPKSLHDAPWSSQRNTLHLIAGSPSPPAQGV